MYYGEMNLFSDLKIYIVASEKGVQHIWFDSDDHNEQLKKLVHDENYHHVKEAKRQLQDYAEGRTLTFDLPLDIKGTDFQKEVWLTLEHIPYGQTWSYSEVAESVNRSKAVRAVGQANRRNPLPIILPCHRVIGKNGALTGYAGSQTHIKEKLLMLERNVAKGAYS
ncbi:MAG: methylated-DNA--protein-cysteine methyltransferase [Priestia megaterium]|uniref:methylated-DNA--[protein]-cysteine S-methyltransferase n=1 Tax=Priestia aryabhattai TaxID=412384 RepID=UPI001C8E638D|nr:methylated-DNA--[protein]-cysteine S-methyltransferase [Priestia aryabhattai]MBX9987659.1 methylated-DNA--[protein]-cysteine S-methyltransferase [Priestia aryabhattai]MBX9998716.1 methylated-DNA--[protein]-cysteine S-methyltransferase [Priestia aryabhattai]